MKRFLTICFLLNAFLMLAQEKGTITGIVLDKDVNNEPLAFATISVKGTQINATSDLDGVHTLKMNPGTYTLIFNFPGYKKIEVPNVLVKKNQITYLKDISLASMTLTLPEDIGEKEEVARSKR